MIAGIELQFDTHGNEKQKQCARYWIDKETIDIVYGGAKGGGKSYLGCSLIFSDALVYPDTRYFIARKKLNDLRKYTISSIYEVLHNWGLSSNYYKYDGQDNYFKLYNGSKVFLLEAKYLPGDDPLFKRFGSMQMTRGWIEEAGEFEEAAKTNLQISIGRWKNDEYGLSPKLLQTCNPSKNYLYREYYKKDKDGELEQWKKFIKAFPQDNKMLPKGYVENLYRILTTNEIERLINGNWEYDDDPSRMIEYENILNMFTNDFVDGGNKYITADIARLGKDKTVIGYWNGYRCEDIITLKKSEVTETANKIHEIANKYKIPRNSIIVDEDGVGGGVKDILQCKGFINNSSPRGKSNFDNLKSQCSFWMANKINNNKVYVNINGEIKDIIIEECEIVKKKNIDKDGKQAIIAKDEMKKHIGRSPDYWDMIMMRAYFDVRIKNKIRIHSSEAKDFEA